jgi:hypothetical protein
MQTFELDQTLRATLADPAPASVHEHAQVHFQLLATRVRSRLDEPAHGRPHKSRWWWWTVLGFFGTAAAGVLLLGLFNSAAHAEVEFAGILATSEKTLFHLVDKSTGVSSGWVGLRQEFAGYTVSSYDAKTDLLTLIKDGVKRDIRLRDSKVQAGSFDVTGTVTLDAGEKLEVERATLNFDQENNFPLKNGVVVHLTPKRLPDGNILFQAVYDRPTTDGKIEHLAAPTVIVLPNSGFSVTIASKENPRDSLGFSFKPKGN